MANEGLFQGLIQGVGAGMQQRQTQQNALQEMLLKIMMEQSLQQQKMNNPYNQAESMAKIMQTMVPVDLTPEEDVVWQKNKKLPAGVIDMGEQGLGGARFWAPNPIFQLIQQQMQNQYGMGGNR